jgi:hypothetical protein
MWKALKCVRRFSDIQLFKLAFNTDGAIFLVQLPQHARAIVALKPFGESLIKRSIKAAKGASRQPFVEPRPVHPNDEIGRVFAPLS